MTLRLLAVLLVTIAAFIIGANNVMAGSYAIWAYGGTDVEVTTAKERLPYRLAILTFEDDRPDIERSVEARKKANIEGADYYTDDSYIYEKDKAKEISRWIVTHLKKANLFRYVERLDIKSSDYYANKVDMEVLSKKQFDFVLVGRIEHLYGYVEGINEREKLQTQPLLGHLIKTAQNAQLKNNPIKSHAKFSDVKLIDIKTGAVLWEGTLENKVDQISKDFIVATTVANIAFQHAFNDLIPVIEQAISEPNSK